VVGAAKAGSLNRTNCVPTLKAEQARCRIILRRVDPDLESYATLYDHPEFGKIDVGRISEHTPTRGPCRSAIPR
jgi:hypothetical protein